jgi:SAM-dependent methyltransferase
VKNSNSITYFDENAGKFSDMTHNRPEFQERYRVFSYYLDKYKVKNGEFMDLGAGNGEITSMLLKYGKTVAIDGSENMVNHLSERFNYELNNNLLNVFKYSLPLPNEFIKKNSNKYDIVVLSSVIEYIENDLELLKQISNLLTANGKLIISYPNYSSLYRKIEKHIIRYIKRGSYLNFVKRFYTLRDLVFLSRETNLELIENSFFSLPNYKIFSIFLKRKRPAFISTLGIAIFYKNVNDNKNNEIL